ncbi:MAG: hypothetical protein ACFFAE_18620 [Candidatus Hodarchaeota archaeon]
MEKFLGHYCKIVYKQTGDKKSALTGEVIDLNNSGFILIENQDGMHCLNTRKIISIKPREKTVGREL